MKSFQGVSKMPSVLIKNQIEKGTAIYLNLSPIEYWDPDKRFSLYGNEWRNLVSEILQEAVLWPRAKVYENGNAANMIECLYWKNGDKHFLGVVKNPTEHRERASIGKISPVQGVTGEETVIRLEFSNSVELINLRTGQHFRSGRVFYDRFKPWEGNLYETIYSTLHKK